MCSGTVSRIFGYHQDDQESSECPKNGDLEDLGTLDGDFVIVNPIYDTFMGGFRFVFLYIYIQQLKGVAPYVRVNETDG